MVLGVEVIMAMRRQYFTEGPKEQIRGNFGDPSSPELRFVVMGDSTSVGVGTDPESSFPWRLSEKLSERFYVKLFVVGRSSARAADVAETQLPQAISLEPDLLLMAIGANDATHLTPSSRVKRSVQRVVDVTRRTSTHLVVVGPPDMGTTRAFAEPLRSLSGWSGRRVERAIRSELPDAIAYVDLARGTGESFDRDPEKHYSDDMFHPSKQGYALWANVIYPTVAKVAADIRRGAT